MTKDKLISHMVGRSLDNLFPKEIAPKGEETLRVEHLNSAGVLFDMNFSAYAGQVPGFSGPVGAGRTETMRAIFGAENVATYKIKTPTLDTPVGSLSGGNQQKVVLGKWVNMDADIYIFDEPTRGIDVWYRANCLKSSACPTA